MILHQPYMTHCPSLFALISYYAIVMVFSFALMFTDSWFTDCAMAFVLVLFTS